MAKSKLLLLLCLHLAWQARSQNETMQADTALAQNLMDRAIVLMKKQPTADSAFLLTSQAISIYQKYFGEESIQVGKSYHLLSILYAIKDKPELAIEYAFKALAITQATIGYNTIQVSNILLNLGLWYRGIDDEAATKYTETCLALRKQLYGENHPEVGGVYLNLALIYWERRDYNRAIDYNLKFLSILEQSPQKDSFAIANAYTGLANNYALLGRYDQVNMLYEKALAMRLEQLGFYDALVARTYSNMGHFYLEQKRYTEALECQKNALKIRKVVLTPDHLDIATSYNNLGLVLDAVGQIDSAISCLQNCISIRELKLPPTHPRIGSACYNLAESYMHKGNHSQAIEYYRKAFYNQIENMNIAGIDCISTLQALLHALDLEKRHQEIMELFSNLELENNPVLYPVSLQGKIRLLQIKGQYFSNIYGTAGFSPEKSLEPYEEMDRLLSSEEYLSWSPDLQQYFLSDMVQGYFSGAEACIKVTQFPGAPNYLDRAFRYSEKAKGFLLYGKLKDESAKLTAGIPDSILQAERTINSRISQLESIIDQKKSKGATDQDSSVLVWSGQLFDQHRALEDFKKDLEAQYPRYFRLKYDLNTVSIPFLQGTILRQDQALIEFFTGDNMILAYVVTKDSFSIIKIQKDFPLEDWVTEINQAISEYPKMSGRSDRAQQASVLQYLEKADSLYQKLIRPLGPLPESLIIVPDGILGYLPFEALLENRPVNRYYFKGFDYFCKKHSINYCYSTTLLHEMRSKQHQNTPSLEFLGFAPYYTGDTSLLASIYGDDHSMRKDLSPLPNSGKELFEVQKIMGGIPYYGPDATESRFLKAAGEARILHLATHARADHRAGNYAWLAFSEIKDSIENELIFIRDLYNMRLNADLVVLSACETALGKLQQGEGIISLARAFAYAGAKSMLTTLWNVNDTQSTELMILFYRNFKNGMAPDKALWKAKLEYIEKNEGDKTHPYYWASFIGIGF